MRVLGVDPGLTRCGLGVVDGGPGRTVRCVAVDVVRTPVDADLAVRLLQVADAVEQWLDLHKPEVVAVERVFSQYNVRTAMGTAQAGGVVALTAARRGIPVVFHTPSEVKAAVTGSGRADKAQVTTMVTRLLRLAEAPRPADAADALALAICHLWRAPMRSRLADAQARAAQLARNHRARLAAGQEAATTARSTQPAQPGQPAQSARSRRSAPQPGSTQGSNAADSTGDPQSGGPVSSAARAAAVAGPAASASAKASQPRSGHPTAAQATPTQPGTGGADR